MTALTIFLIAVSLSMDAFAVSVCGGMRLAEDRKFRGTGLGLVSFRL